MSEPKFTPGPWIVPGARHKGDLKVGPDCRLHMVGPDGDAVCAVFFDMRTGCGFADAHLIAAAPDMYEVLKEIAERLRNCAANIKDEYPIWASDLRKMSDNASAAFAKTEGKT